MGKTFKRIVVAFSAFFGVLIIAGFLLPPFMDWNKYRGQVETIASSILNEQVKVGGDVALKLLPYPEVTASSVRIVSASGGDDMVAVETLHIRMDTLALLGGKVAVSSLELSAPHITIIESEGAGWHMEGFKSDEGDATSQSIQLNNVLLRDGSITFKPLSGGALTLDTFSIDFSGELPLGPMGGHGSFKINDVPVEFEARLLPMSDGKSQSLRFVATSDSNELELTGRVMTQARFNGRLKVKAETVSGLSHTVAAMQGAEAPTIFPAVPLFVDVRVDTSPGRIEVEGRRVLMGESEGRLDLRVVGQSKKRFSGALALGSIDMDLWNFGGKIERSGTSVPAINWPENVSGVLDVTAEALTWHGQLVRQVDVSLEMNKDKLVIEKAQALVPGGGELSLGGESLWDADNPKFIGRVGMKSGRFRDFLTWWGVHFSSIPNDKLMSIAWRSDLEATFNSWSVENIDAVMDDSHVTGSAAGDLNYGLTTLGMTIDSINFDAYSKGEESSQLDMWLPNSTTLKIETLTLQGHQITQLELRADAMHTTLNDLSLKAKAFGGTFTLNAKVNNYQQWDGLEGTIVAEGMGLDDLRLDFDSLKQANQLLAGPVTFRSTFNGSFPELNTKNSLTVGDDIITSDGRVVFNGPSFGELSAVFMSGEAKIKSSEKLLTWFGLEPNSGPSNLNFNGGGALNKELMFEVSGDVTGIETVATGALFKPPEIQRFQGSMMVIVPEALRANTPFSFLKGKGPLKATAYVELLEDTMTFKDISLSQENALLTGEAMVGRGDNKTFAGVLTAKGFNFENSAAGGPVTFDNGWRQTAFSPLPLQDYRGDVTIILNDVSALGQVVSEAFSTLSFDGNGIGFKIHEATINDAPATAAFRLDRGAGESLSLSTTINMEKLKLEPFTARLFGPAIKGTEGSMTLTLDGNGRSEHALVKTLRGEGSFNAAAGMLRFMDAPKLITAINSTESRGGFLLALPKMLDEGYSDINNLAGTFAVERGVLTLAPLTAKGSWGILSLPGTLDIPNRSINLKGQVKLIDPIDLGAMPIAFAGPVTAPKAKYDTVSLMRFADAAIGRRMRAKLAEEQKQALDENGGAVEPTGKLFDLVKKVLKATKPKPETEPGGAIPPAEQTP